MFYYHYSLIADADHFREMFDKEMHRYLYRKQMQSRGFVNQHVYLGSIPFHDLFGFKNCQAQLGKWKFVIEHQDYSCGVYKALEIFRHAIVSAMQANKQSMDIAIVFDKANPKMLNWIPYDRELHHYLDAESMRKRAYLFSKHKNEHCKCAFHIPRVIFSQYVYPVLKRLLKSIGMQVSFVILKNIVINQRSGPASSMYFKKDLQGIRVEWGFHQRMPEKEEKTRNQKRQNPYSVHVSACDRPWLEKDHQQGMRALENVETTEIEEIREEIADWKIRQTI